MYDEPEYNEYDDDEYKYYPDGSPFNEYNEHGFPKEFKFDWASWEQWLKDALDDIILENESTWIVQPKKFPVSGNDSQGTSKFKYFVYLGNNHYGEEVWDTKYFINDKIDQLWKQYLQSNAAYLLKEPQYYKGMFDNLN